MQSKSIIKNITIQDKARKESPISMRCFAATFGGSYPATSFSDYIENKTKVGGILEMSMLQAIVTRANPVLAMSFKNDNWRPKLSSRRVGEKYYREDGKST